MVGGLQVIVGVEQARLPYRRVWPEVNVIGASVAHVTMLALEKQYRGHPALFGPLCVELWRFCIHERIEQILIEATPQTLRLYRRIGWPLEVVGDLRPHWGEECCYLCRMSVQQVAEALLRKAHRSATNRRLVEQAYRDLTLPSLLTEAACF